MNKALVIIGLALTFGVIASYTDLPLPPGVGSVATVEGRIKTCDIENHVGGKSRPSLLFVGITMDEQAAPYLRWNPPKPELERIRLMCKEQRAVSVTYKAKRTLLRPKVSFWIEQLEIKA